MQMDDLPKPYFPAPKYIEKHIPQCECVNLRGTYIVLLLTLFVVFALASFKAYRVYRRLYTIHDHDNVTTLKFKKLFFVYDSYSKCPIHFQIKIVCEWLTMLFQQKFHKIQERNHVVRYFSHHGLCILSLFFLLYIL